MLNMLLTASLKERYLGVMVMGVTLEMTKLQREDGTMPAFAVFTQTRNSLRILYEAGFTILQEESYTEPFMLSVVS